MQLHLQYQISCFMNSHTFTLFFFFLERAVYGSLKNFCFVHRKVFFLLPKPTDFIKASSRIEERTLIKQYYRARVHKLFGARNQSIEAEFPSYKLVFSTVNISCKLSSTSCLEIWVFLQIFALDQSAHSFVNSVTLTILYWLYLCCEEENIQHLHTHRCNFLLLR